ncbi:olfactory receptor 11A1-like [Maylandia zebra]|uniref:olfactory receptor 11A1-like n=1 Tax=Maylandia zebra TaxID=106582 RepID=UPI000329E139|nr:olfactory receptor 11A1-like [Maylandia zebra]XP_005953563.1 olfactory receptor 11A1-like [Haplochromis burtoni]XP_025999789.1 olfactory receptor 11A1-like [Astatotilapia calliptera]
MDDELNITHITIDGYVDLKRFGYLYFLIMVALYVLIIISNSVIVFLICIHHNLHEPMYIFIAALSVNSVLLSTVTYPKLFVDVLSEKQIISISACRFQHFMCYSIAGSDFLLLSAMAFDRYVSICKPLKYPVIMRQTTINTLLFLSWFVPGLQIAVLHTLVLNNKLCNFTLKGILCNNSLWKLYCESPRATLIYGLVVMLSVVIFPVFFILFTYAKIFLITYRSSRAIQKKAAETCLPHLFVLSIFTTLCAYDVIIGRLELDFPKTAQLIMTLQVIFYNPLLNPFIYGLKMKEISKHLKRLFCHVRCS